MFKKLITYVTGLLIASTLLAIWIFWSYCLDYLPRIPSSDLGNLALRGSYGSSYVALNTLFSALALFGVIYTIFKQQHDKYESHFFRLLDLWHSYVNQLEIKSFKGRIVISVIHAHFRNVHRHNRRSSRNVSKSNKEIFVDSYNSTFKKYETTLSPYFRTLYHTFRYIQKSSIYDKEQFSDIVRAILSGKELALLAANCLTDQGSKFKPLVEKFHLLKHLPPDRIMPLTMLDLKREFKPSAFHDTEKDAKKDADYTKPKSQAP